MLLATIKVLLFFMIAIYATLVALLYLRQEQILFVSTPLPAERKHAFASYEWALRHGDVTLKGWYVPHRPQDPKPLIIYYGGNAEEVSETFVDRYKLHANGFLFMNYRSYGESTGRPSESALFSDALFVYDKLIEKAGLSPQQIVLMGRSLGTGVATYVARHRVVRSVILVTPYDSLVEVARHNYSWAPVRWLLKNPFNSVGLAPQIQEPMLNIMASGDTLIPVSHAQNLAKAWSGPVTSVTLEGAGHGDINGYDEYWNSINRFLDQTEIQPLRLR